MPNLCNILRRLCTVNCVWLTWSPVPSNPTTTLDEIVRAVNEVGAAPGDLVAILEALKAAGALRAELVVI